MEEVLFVELSFVATVCVGTLGPVGKSNAHPPSPAPRAGVTDLFLHFVRRNGIGA
jgi:hypothetical protein